MALSHKSGSITAINNELDQSPKHKGVSNKEERL
jgi:hypothetical protein